MIKLGTMQVGNKLVRMFGEGDKIRRVTTEVVDGKILTQVFDKDGNHVVSRMKAMAADKVGNKTVRTTTKVYQDSDGFARRTTDRVYNSADKFVGSRTVFEQGFSPDTLIKRRVSKQGTDGIKLVKKFSEDGTVYKKVVPGNYLTYNFKGLPISELSTCSGFNVNNMSLREMMDLHNVNFPGQPYAAPEFRMPKLNEIGGRTVLANVDTSMANDAASKLGAMFDKTV